MIAGRERSTVSRIAGIFPAGSTERRTSQLNGMLEACRGGGHWEFRRQEDGVVSLGWCGWGEPNVASVEGVLAVLDGAIYNREELGTARNDAGLLADLYQRYGFAAALQKINGDFSAALFDSAAHTLWIGRDRFGVKPLYYLKTEETFAFASRPSALLTLPGVAREVNRQYVGLFAASHYRYFDNDPGRSPYRDIAQLPGSHLLCVKDTGWEKKPYWSLQDAPELADSEADLAERYRELVLDAVSLRLQSADRPAFTLSGGMDSSSVMACAVRVTGKKQTAFSTIYEDPTYDESAEIRTTLDHTVERWHPVNVGNPEIPSMVSRMIDLHDEPVATATWLSHYLLCQEVQREGFDVLFGGLGGDELNAGEYEHFLYFFADLRSVGCDSDLERETRKWIEYHDHPVFRKSRDVLEDGLSRMTDPSRPGRCLPDRNRLHRYASALNPDYFDLNGFDPAMDHHFTSYLKNRTWQDLTRETIPCCLRAEDRNSIAFDLHPFLPFFDHRLVEFMFRIPGTLKIRDGVTKHLLREAMRGILPTETRTRVKKSGWNAPAHMWFSGFGRDFLLDLIGSQDFRERGIYEVKEVRRLLNEHETIVASGAPMENHMMFLWQVVNLELWLRTLDTREWEMRPVEISEKEY